jgi:hypothetical protein
VFKLEATRFWELMDKVKEKNAYKSDAFRELLELAPPNLLTKEEIHYFRTQKKL